MWWDLQSHSCCKFNAESAGERIAKIYQHSAKISTTVESLVLFFLLTEYNRFSNQRSNIEKQHQTMTANNI